MTTARLRDAGGGWRCSDDDKCCTSPTGSRHHAHRIVGELLVCSTGEHQTVRVDGRQMTAVPAAGAMPRVPGAHRRSLTPDTSAADVSAVLDRLRSTTASLAVSSATISPLLKLRVVAGTAHAAGDRDQRDVVREIQQRVSRYAKAARMQEWARQLTTLADEIAPEVCSDDAATLRRLAARFAAVGARLVRTA